ncbi:MAG TPA: MBL fold metallo-hydrolase [Thermoanaerobaculia bacterium]|jgi:ribonuclease Z|nr:MBL fold metallo-hydrolase [Thermoanaerobaculia bacterium]
MTDKDSFRLQTPHFVVEGSSRAGHETWFRIRDLGVALDIGRCPDSVVSMEHVFITHAHLDHAAGIPFYAAQRKLQQLDPGRIYVPAESAEGFEELLAVQRKLTGSELRLDVVGMGIGDEVRFGRNHLVRAYAASHRIAARAYELVEVRHHLREEFAGMSPEDIARLRREGVKIDEPYSRSLLFYTGDTDRGLLETCEAAFKAEVLMIECSFVMDGHQDRAAQYRHIHIDDIADFADRFENELIVLTHFSRRYSREEIRDGVRRRLPVSLHDRIRLALPEPWQRLA